MPDFEELRQRLNIAREERKNATKAVFLAKERLKKIERQIQRTLRRNDQQSDAFTRLKGNESTARETLKRAETHLAGVRVDEDRFWHDFEPFTDPRGQLGRLSDDFPILLFPVRLETRFKVIARSNDTVQHQLWVRVFPDECSIDSFDETLAESEIVKATAYWSQVWSIGKAESPELETFIDQKARGAWRELMGTVNAGRAYWIKEKYKPVDETAIPVRTTEMERILVVPTQVLPETATRDALRSYWIAVVMAGGAPEASSAAFAALRATLGLDETAARSLIDANNPYNIREILKSGKPPPSAQLVFMRMPSDLDSKLNVWSQAARVTSFPERFVLLGFRKDIADPVIEELGEPVSDPLIVGPDPSLDIDDVLRAEVGSAFDDFTDDQKAQKYIDYLSKRSETKWLFDFDEAVRVGMGFKVDVSPQVYEQGLDQLFVLGVRISETAGQGKATLENLFRNHQFGDTGFSILPQGTATNNTEEASSGYSEAEDADALYDNYHRDATPDDPTDDANKRDGRWLAELLGIDVDSSSLKLAPGYYLKDQCEAMAMNAALWSATLGYFMESMLTPVFKDWQREFARRFFIDHVKGRGRLPAIRIGDQPYGILPVSTISEMPWLDQAGLPLPKEFLWLRRGLKPLHSKLQIVRERLQSQLGSIAYVGKDDEDAHKLLLEALGLHATSVEFDQRYAESFLHHYNWLVAMGEWGENLVELLAEIYRRRGLQLLSEHDYEHDRETDPKIPILEKTFFTKAHDIQKPLIDDQDLSEENGIRAYTETGENYIEWLIDKAKSNHRDIREQNSFLDDKAPYALLYDMLRLALNLQFTSTGLNLYESAEILDPAEASLLRVDADFIGIQAQPTRVESKWDLIYRTDERLEEEGVMLVDSISTMVSTGVVNSQTRHLHELIEALEHLKDVPTARLERAFVEHLDLCSYRLDAWLLGLVNAQLQGMRRKDEAAGQGIYLGAFGWLENLESEDKNLEPVELSPELSEIFDPDGTRDPKTDDKNAGYVHAPSVNHALTAAVLRNAYISNASEQAAEIYKVNLSSERVRAALAIIEGMQQGQSLGALLGYQLERGLHDRTSKEMDVYIYEMRKVFSLGSNKLTLTEIRLGKPAETDEEAQRNREEEQEFTDDKAISKIEARNVIDGIKLLDHVRKTNEPRYPFGFPTGEGPGHLKEADHGHAEAINAQVERIMSIRDAVADLAMAESVHQVVQGNYERAAGALDAYSKGNYPQMPDVIRSPTNGVNITHRFGIHLPSGIAPTAADTPRAKAEPAVNKWMQDLLPLDFSRIACRVAIKTPNYGAAPDAVAQKTVTMANLGLSPIDLLYLMDVERDRNLAGLDELILDVVYADGPLRPDVDVEIEYTHAFPPADEIVSFFELSPMVANLRKLVLSARPLMPADIALQNEGTEDANRTLSPDPSRISAARQVVLDRAEGAANSLKADVVDPLEPLIDDEDFDATLANKAAILAQIDSRLDQYVARLKGLHEYGIAEAGFGFVFDRKRAIHGAVKSAVAAYRKRWLGKLDRYDELINEDLPGTSGEERSAILKQAEGEISTEMTLPAPTMAEVTAKKAAFDGKFHAFGAFLTANHADFQSLLGALTGLAANLDQFDNRPLDVETHEREIVVLAEDAYKHADKLVATTRQRMETVGDLLGEVDSTGEPEKKFKLLADAAKGVFGEDFRIVPEFALGEEQGNEIRNCLNDRDALLSYQTDVKSVAFPMDDWLYGVARVREKLAAWESVVVLAEGYKDRSPMTLVPVQFPHVESDHWLGLEYPQDFEITSDKLLYTAYLPSFDPALPQCGLLVDEWTEIIPAKQDTTGLTFHYDRPNSEPAQSLLLVTPPEFTGEWEWPDVVNTMRETLDLARLRALEPDHFDQTDYVRFLPATVAAAVTSGATIAANFAFPADQVFHHEVDIDG